MNVNGMSKSRPPRGWSASPCARSGLWATYPWPAAARAFRNLRRIFCTSGQVRPVLPDPRLNVLGLPDVPHDQLTVGLREIGSHHELLDTLPSHPEAQGDLCGAHVVMHDREHTRQGTCHLTTGATLDKVLHVTCQVSRATELRTRPIQLGMFDLGHDRCIHTKYLLTCDQYEELQQRSGGLCELCGTPGVTQLWGRLCIDHDHAYGMWAVRGLLCHRCNKRATNRPDLLPGLDRYLANSWYLGLTRQLGITLDPPPEPPIGTRVTSPTGLNWRRTAEGWTRLDPRPNTGSWERVLRWSQLTYRYGAHNLTKAGQIRPAEDLQGVAA